MGFKKHFKLSAIGRYVWRNVKRWTQKTIVNLRKMQIINDQIGLWLRDIGCSSSFVAVNLLWLCFRRDKWLVCGLLLCWRTISALSFDTEECALQWLGEGTHTAFSCNLVSHLVWVRWIVPVVAELFRFSFHSFVYLIFVYPVGLVSKSVVCLCLYCPLCLI